MTEWTWTTKSSEMVLWKDFASEALPECLRIVRRERAGSRYKMSPVQRKKVAKEAGKMAVQAADALIDELRKRTEEKDDAAE